MNKPKSLQCGDVYLRICSFQPLHSSQSISAISWLLYRKNVNLGANGITYRLKHSKNYKLGFICYWGTSFPFSTNDTIFKTKNETAISTQNIKHFYNERKTSRSITKRIKLRAISYVCVFIMRYKQRKQDNAKTW